MVTTWAPARDSAPAAATKFLTVEELVKVIASNLGMSRI